MPFVPEGTSCLSLPVDVSHHIARVLKYKPGTLIELRDEQGRAYKARIQKVSGQNVTVTEVHRINEPRGESPLHITLMCALAPSEKLEKVIRQATELGVNKIVVFPARRSKYSLKGEQIERKIERWRRIAADAVCQCGRTKLPDIKYDQNLVTHDEFYDVKLVACEKATASLIDLIKSQKCPRVRRLCFSVGPESGWTKEEIKTFRAAGFVAVRFGTRILRYETAVVSLTAICQFVWGDLGFGVCKEEDNHEMP